MRLLKLALLFVLGAPLCAAQSIPAIKAKALDDSEIILPKPAGQQILIFIAGFSRKSGKLCEVWSKKIAADYRADARVAYFSLPVLQDAPSLFRPMILYGMRKGVPTEELPHFVPLYANEPEWKKLVNFSAPDDAYLIVATPDGNTVWQAHGEYSDALYADLRNSVEALLARVSKPSKN